MLLYLGKALFRIDYHQSAWVSLMEVLWLTEKEVESLLTMDDAIPAVEKAFLDHGLGRAQMPPKSYLCFSKCGGDMRTMPAYLEGLDMAGVKIVTVHPGNPERGLPTVMALLVLNSPKTGAPVSVMGATYLTGMRTGAAGAVAAKHLARPESDTLGFVGAGAQARTQLMGLARFFKIRAVMVSDPRAESMQAFERAARNFMPSDCEFRIAADPKEACDCDILVTTTPVCTPIIKSAWIRPGTHINAIGADAKGKQELESALTRRAKIVVDDMVQALHSGEVNVPITEGSLRPEEIYAQIGEIVTGAKMGRAESDEITIFDSTGLGILDVAVGSSVFKKAQSARIGTNLGFI